MGNTDEMIKIGYPYINMGDEYITKDHWKETRFVIMQQLGAMKITHDKDIKELREFFEDKIKESTKIRIVDISILEKRLIKLEEATLKHNNGLAVYLEGKFEKIQAQVDKIAWGLQVVEERH